MRLYSDILISKAVNQRTFFAVYDLKDAMTLEGVYVHYANMLEFAKLNQRQPRFCAFLTRHCEKGFERISKHASGYRGIKQNLKHCKDLKNAIKL